MVAETIQDLSRLLEKSPAQLLDEPISSYGALLRADAAIEREHLETIDYVVRHTVVRLLVRAAQEEELEDACSSIRRLIPVRKEEEWAVWLPRWRAFADLLEARMGVLTNQDTPRARKLAHAGEILELVDSEPGLTQADIGRRLTLKPANLSRILGVLEAHELIERRTLGRERRVHLGRLSQPQPYAKSDSGLKRGMSYLQLAS